jgi:uncharacterized protein (UPF0276 family)
MLPAGVRCACSNRCARASRSLLHGVSLNIGSADPLDADYLAELDALAARYQPAWISDHLCWTGVRGRNLHDLLPLPYTDDVLAHVCERVQSVQDRLGRRIALENPLRTSPIAPTRCPRRSSWSASRSAPTAGSCST